MTHEYKYKFINIVIGITLGLIFVSLATLTFNIIGLIFGGKMPGFDWAYPIMMILIIVFFSIKIKNNVVVKIDEDTISQYTTKIAFSDISEIKEIMSFYTHTIIISNKLNNDKIVIFMPKALEDYNNFTADLERIKQQRA